MTPEDIAPFAKHTSVALRHVLSLSGGKDSAALAVYYGYTRDDWLQGVLVGLTLADLG